MPEIPEVEAFNLAKQDLETFKANNPKFFEILEMLATRYNDTLEAAEKAVRGLKVSAGDFNLYQWANKVDGNGVHDALGRNLFLEMGGSITTNTVYKIDAKAVELALSRKLINAEVAEGLVSREPRYKTPSKVVL